MARHGTLTRKDFEQVSAAMADLLAAVQATITTAPSRAEAAMATSLQYGNCVKTLAAVLARSNTSFDKNRFLAEAMKPLSAGSVESSSGFSVKP